MARLDPLNRADLPQLAEALDQIEADHGYIPNSFLTLARDPTLLAAQHALAQALWYGQRIAPEVRQLVAFGFSLYNGAMYSAAHTAAPGADTPLPIEQLRAVRDAETSPVYSAQQRALLRLCRAAARVPSEVKDEHVAALRTWFDDQQLVQIVGLIAWHAFLNTWNGIWNTRLEDQPRAFAQASLAGSGWHGQAHQ
ncbi:hypothetical protein [uncultured Hydrogenophaga sp.]|uniref:carboxymuconolactone decarboxylase family protein n=1 Tax=uncultured Hydrogenophaga sp. TaxID=199683 RepID=UPI00258389FB|nr:hypothetical protein [uncultured Hydrogenophaga sp.]